MIKVSENTTSGTLAIRLTGYKYQNISYDSQYGKTLTRESLKSLILPFFTRHLRGYINEINKIIDVVQKNPMRLYSASILVCHDEFIFNTKLIDFQHSIVGDGDGVDVDVIKGLENLLIMIDG
jgi:hypothetical protein